MIIGLRQHGAALLVALAVAFFACVSSAPAQSLPPDIYTADPLTAEQRQLITDFANTNTQALGANANASNEDVTKARTNLMQALVVNSSPAFRAALSEAISNGLNGALQNPSEHVRINVMIVAARLNYTPVVLELVERGLQDASPAVRYWSAKATRPQPATGAGGATSTPPPQEAQAAMLQQLGDLLAKEEAVEVLDQVFSAMVDLAAKGNNEALRATVEALNRRVSVHVADPRLGYTAEKTGLDGAYGRLLQLEQQNPGNVNEIFLRIGVAAARYMALIARQAAANEIPPQNLETAKQILDSAYQILAYIHDKPDMKSNAQIVSRTQFSLDLRANNWNAIQVAANQFRDMLTSAPYNLDVTDVTVAAD